MKRTILALACIALLSTALHAAGEGKHLFILSGQSNMAGMNPNISFIPAVEKEFGKENVIVVKDAHSGRAICDWSKHQGSLDGKGHKNSRSGLYSKLMKKVKPAIEGHELQTVTFVWMQGERDAKMKRSDVYEKAFLKLLQQVEADVGKKDINFVIGRLSDHGDENIPDWARMREIHVKLAEDSPRGEWVDTDDLNNKTRGPKSWDDLHLTRDGYKILGERFAEKAIELIKGK